MNIAEVRADAAGGVVIDLIAAARPNFMKVAPLYHALRAEPWCRPRLVHTGQHYDPDMSDAFFRDLGLPAPDFHLGVGSGTHAAQTAGVMVAYERVCLEQRPDRIVVVGDVNSTLACALVGAKLHIPVVHLEAGLRSGDRRMPEEINRLATDAIADVLWTPSPDADLNLQREGVDAARIECLGNIMIDSYEMLRATIAAAGTAATLGLQGERYGVVTLHRPSNVDTAAALGAIVDELVAIAARVRLVFPVHPRTRGRLDEFGLRERLASTPGLVLTTPQPYVPFMNLVSSAAFVITDSGGVQEETTYLGIPCLTLRETTERPITVTQGSNRLVRIGDVAACVEKVLSGGWPTGSRPARWDGATASRAVASLRRLHGIASGPAAAGHDARRIVNS